jgi:hypothetical protein
MNAAGPQEFDECLHDLVIELRTGMPAELGKRSSSETARWCRPAGYRLALNVSRDSPSRCVDSAPRSRYDMHGDHLCGGCAIPLSRVSSMR